VSWVSNTEKSTDVSIVMTNYGQVGYGNKRESVYNDSLRWHKKHGVEIEEIT